MNDEQLLIEQAQQGDADAFGRLVQLHQDRLFTSITHMVGHLQEAEDIVQDAFVQAYLKLHTFQGKSTFYTWLYRIAMHCIANRHRKRRPEISADQALETLGHEPIDQGSAPADRLLHQEQALLIQQALRQLSSEYRSILVLREIENFDYDTIARVLEISVGTVRSRLHRARSAMRTQIERLRQREAR